MTLVNIATGEIVATHPEEPGAVTMLNQAIRALTTALDQMPISEVANLKAKVATVATATRELGMSKEAQELAVEAVRRAEWALRRATKKGQEAGEVARRDANLRNNTAARNDASSISTTPLPAPRDFFSSESEYRDANAMAQLDQDQFEAVLNEAKAEGNLSRASVAAKAREASRAREAGKGSAPKPAPAGTDERNHQEAELINSFGSIVRRSLTAKNVATLSPKAKARLISILEDALATLKEEDQ